MFNEKKLVDHSSELEEKRTFMSFDRYYEINVYNLSRPLAEKKQQQQRDIFKSILIHSIKNSRCEREPSLDEFRQFHLLIREHFIERKKKYL